MIAGRYRLVERIGTGGMGVVWRAIDEVGVGRTLALKRVHLDEWMTADERDGAVTLLRREAEVAASVSGHDNIVDVHGSVEHEGEPWLVMEYVPGRDLGRIVSEEGPLPPPRAAHLGAQLASALAHLHRAGIVHGDVTPRNILVSDSDQVTLADFGISRIESERTLTTRGRPAGVLAFFAPEVAGGRKPSSRSDVFGLGAVLHHAMEGSGPWGSGDERTLYARVEGHRRAVAERRPTRPGAAPVAQAASR